VGAQGITAWVAGSGEPLLVNDVEKDPRYLFWPDAAETRSELAVPLKTKSGVIGVLNVESTEVNGFDESDNLVLQSIAQQAAIAIENAQLFEQAQQLAVIQERQRLARDLHDSVTQALYGITLYAEAATRQLSQKHANYELAADHLHDLQGTAQEALREMRLLIFELRPPILEQEGLVAALRIRLDTVEVRSGVKVAFNVEGTRRPLPTKTEAGLYRIAQEALNNALKHSQATEIDVRLHYDLQGVTLEISDDGAGFDLLESASTGGFGLSGMRERATEMDGKLTIKSKPGHGTLIRAEVSQ
jgi:signal transduction histidine kinase